MDSRALLQKVDDTWYSQLSPKWMDVLGDYAGAELVLIDGDAICQQVLNDPLLALGKSQDCSFQILHALWSVEKFISEFVSRRCNFEVVFFEVSKPLTLYGGETRTTFAVSSRRLARTILKRHMEGLPIRTTTFEAPEGDTWKAFIYEKKPICLLCNDGSKVDMADDQSLASQIVLLQRKLILTLVSSGISIVSLEAAEFRGTKIISFVYEPLSTPKDLEAIKILERQRWLDNNDARFGQPRTFTPLPPSDVRDRDPLKSWIKTTARVYLQDISRSSSNDALFVTFLLHMAIIPYLPLKDRAQRPVALHPDLESELSRNTMPQILMALDHTLCLLGPGWVPDLDGRVFLNLLSVLVQNQESTDDFKTILGHKIADRTRFLMDTLRGYGGARDLPLTPTKITTALSRWKHEMRPSPSNQESHTSFTLLPFHNSVLSECLKPIQFGPEFPSSDSPNSPSTSSRKRERTFKETGLVIYREVPEDDDLLRTLDQEQLRREKEKNDQELSAYLHRYATTLLEARWTPFRRLTIPAAKRSIMDLPREASPPHLNPNTPLPEEGSSSGVKPTSPKSKKTPKSQQPKLTSAERLRLRIQEEKEAKSHSDSETWWKQQLRQLEAFSTPWQKARFFANVLRDNRRLDDTWVWTETLLYQVNQHLSEWIADSRQEQPAIQAQYCADILHCACEIFSKGVPSDEGAKFIRSVLHALGFPLLNFLQPPPTTSSKTAGKRPLTFRPVELAHQDRSKPALYPFLRLPIDFTTFQLEYYGVYMDRAMDGQPDSRVPFIPDAWQRAVLDHLDKRESVVVLAPTSAGKTVISYYAIEQVLRESDDGVLVYVVPTNALVKEAIAEISARFDKTTGSDTVWAAHTPDWRIHEPHQCQILVTVPETLATMLLSPALASEWLPRLRWILLDEMHMLGQQEGGAVWEQLILFAPCPIIGLCATIGNPEELTSWISMIEEARGFKLAVVRPKRRYSQSRKFFYTMTDSPIPFQGMYNKPPLQVKPVHIHPLSVLRSGLWALPDDLALGSDDCLALYHAMRKVAEQSPEKTTQLVPLQPNVFFAQSLNRLLTKNDVIRYASALQLLLTRWSEEDETPTRVLRSVGKELSNRHHLCPTHQNEETVRANIVHLLHDMSRRNDLPAVLFSFDPQTCECTAEATVRALWEAEEAWKNSDDRWQAKVAKWERWKASPKRASEPGKKKRKEGDIPGGSKDWMATFDPKESLPEFSFADWGAPYSKDELQRDINDLEHAGIKPWAIKALKVGVAVHHSGMNWRYLALVESLLRIGFIRVVFATGTLASGINIPFKTSVFLGDSVYLTAQTYRQCAERAGRRGVDLLGKVIFYGIPIDRIHGIMASKLPPLTGNTTLTATLTLRLCHLLHGSKPSPSVAESIKGVFRLSQFSPVSAIQGNELLHHLRLVIEYLRRANLINVEGEPLPMFPLAAHLSYTEPSNLAIVALLRNGALHRLCETIDSNCDDTKRNLVSLLAHFFGRRKLPPVFSGVEVIERLRLRLVKCPSQIALPVLPSDVYETLREHNSQILEICREYGRLYAAQYLSNRPDLVLPVSQTSFPLGGSISEESPFQSALRQNAVPIDALSTFVANSGVTIASLTAVGDLARTTRPGLNLDQNIIPCMDQFLELGGCITNGYIVDYFAHGQIRPLVEANKIEQAALWTALHDFSQCLASLKIGLEQYFRALLGITSDEDTGTGNGIGSRLLGGAEFEYGATATFTSRPYGVADEDWKVYRSVVLAKEDYDQKLKAMRT